MATDDQLDRDTAAVLAAVAEVAGPERAVAAAVRSLPTDAVVGALPFLQRAALDSVASRSLRGKKATLVALREQGAAAAGVEVPKLIEPRRISWVNLVLVVGTLIGGWALIGVLINVGKSWSTITGAEWGWVAVVFVLAQAAYPAIAITTVGSVTNPLPYGRTLALELSDTFVALAGGSMAVLATRVRFFQQEGYSRHGGGELRCAGVARPAGSSRARSSSSPFPWPSATSTSASRRSNNSSGDSHLVWLIVLAVIVAGVVLGLVFAVPRWRRLAAAKLRPKASEVWSHLKLLATHPRNLVEIFGGNVAAQLLVAMALGASLHAFGTTWGWPPCWSSSPSGPCWGASRRCRGDGRGRGRHDHRADRGRNHPSSDAVAAVFVQRLFTAYLPPIWGWFVLVWMRKKEYL